MSNPPAVPAPVSVRSRARQEITRQIVETAQRNLATDGAAALSLRAVARDLGMVSSAIYRYVASRDELLTLLIIDAYDDLGDAAERADGAVAREELASRWLAICRAVRRWALKNPHSYSLIFGSPVPGYAAPQDTIRPATRVPALLIAILLDGARSGGLRKPQPPLAPLTDAMKRSIAPIRAQVSGEVSDELLVGGLTAWTHLFGVVSFELFGHLHNVITDPASARQMFFADQMATMASIIGVPVRATASGSRR